MRSAAACASTYAHTEPYKTYVPSHPHYQSSVLTLTMSSTIPTPPSIPFLGHVTAIDREVPLRSFQLLAEQYGEIYQLNIIGASIVQSRMQKRVLRGA